MEHPSFCFDIDFDFQVEFIPKSIELRIKESIITEIILTLHSLSHTLSCTHSYCTISFHSLFFRKCLVHALIIVPVPIAMLYRQNVEGNNSKKLQLAVCGTVKQEVGEAAWFDNVTSKYDLQSRCNYTSSSFAAQMAGGYII